MVKWHSIHGHPHMHGVTHTSTVYIHANRVYSHPTTEHPSSPPSSQVPHSCSAFSACSVHVTHNTWNNLGRQTHSSQHSSLSLQSGTVSMDTHCAYTHNTPLFFAMVVWRPFHSTEVPSCPSSVTSSSDSLWCVSTSYTNSKVKEHSHAHIAQMV